MNASEAHFFAKSKYLHYPYILPGSFLPVVIEGLTRSPFGNGHKTIRSSAQCPTSSVAIASTNRQTDSVWTTCLACPPFPTGSDPGKYKYRMALKNGREKSLRELYFPPKFDTPHERDGIDDDDLSSCARKWSLKLWTNSFLHNSFRSSFCPGPAISSLGCVCVI